MSSPQIDCCCKQCGKKFKWYTHRNFCSTKCTSIYKSKNRIIKLNQDSICLWCGRNSGDRKSKKFCGQYCRLKFYLNKTEFKDEDNFYEAILKNTGLSIEIRSTEEFLEWLKNNFFLLGLKNIRISENRVAVENFFSQTRVFEVRYFGDDEFDGLSFIKTADSKSKSFFTIDGVIRISPMFQRLLEAQSGLFFGGDQIRPDKS